MKRSTLVIGLAAALVGIASFMPGHTDVTAKPPASSVIAAAATRGSTAAATISRLPEASRAAPASHATTTPASDSRFDNYRLEREGCCIGND